MSKEKMDIKTTFMSCTPMMARWLHWFRNRMLKMKKKNWSNKTNNTFYKAILFDWNRSTGAKSMVCAIITGCIWVVDHIQQHFIRLVFHFYWIIVFLFHLRRFFSLFSLFFLFFSFHSCQHQKKLLNLNWPMEEMKILFLWCSLHNQSIEYVSYVIIIESVKRHQRLNFFIESKVYVEQTNKAPKFWEKKTPVEK